MKKLRAVVSVTNDLVTDQRVHRSCMLLTEMGFSVLLIGRVRRNSLNAGKRPYNIKRIKLLFEKGVLFYASFNLRLFFILLLNRADLYYSNDLDTLLPNFLVSRLKRKRLIYDSHEYFTGVPELQNRPWVQKVWKTLEKIIFPKLQNTITVNRSIAKLYFEQYGVMPHVVRNIPDYISEPVKQISKEDIGLPVNMRIALLQGSGINIDRGAEEAVEAMQYVDNILLLIIGDGDVIGLLKERVNQLELNDKVRFIPKVPYAELKSYTMLADGGLTLDKDTNINYRLSLPNKLFDYIHAGIPILASDLPEVRDVIVKFDIGLLTQSHDPKLLASFIEKLVFDDKSRKVWKENLKVAKSALCWEQEKLILKTVIEKACKL